MNRTYFLPQYTLILLGEAAQPILSLVETVLVQHRASPEPIAEAPNISIEFRLDTFPRGRLPKDAARIRSAYQYEVYEDTLRRYFVFRDGIAMASIAASDTVVDPATATIWISADVFSSPMQFAFYFYFPLIEHLLGAVKVFGIHSAAVASSGKALLLLGASGAGKSTLALALRASGLTIYSEDRPLIRALDNRVCLLPSLGGPKLTQATVSMFSEFADACGYTEMIEQKKVIRFIDAFPEFVLDNPQVAGVLFLERDPNGQGIKLLPISARDAHEKMMLLELFVMLPGFLPEPAMRAQFEMLTTIAQQSKAFRLQYGNADTQDVVVQLKDLLEAL